MPVRVLLALLLLVCAGPAWARWLVAETPHFRIHGTLNERRLREEASVLEDFHALLEQLTQRRFPADAPKLDVYLVDSSAEMRIVSPGIAPSIAGFYVAGPGGIFAVSLEPSGTNREFGREVLLHEYAHHFMMQAGTTALPAWYIEGFAEYLMTAEFRPDRIEFGGLSRGRYYVLSTFPWAPLEQVLRRAPGVNLDSFYAQSWLLTHYLSRVKGMPAKRDAYLRKVSAGADPVEAFRTEIDPDLDAFQSRLRTYLVKREFTFSRMTRQPPEAVRMEVIELPSVANSALLPFVGLQLDPSRAEAEAQLARIRSAVTRLPDDPWDKRVLAIAEAAAGDATAAAARLDALLAEMPDDPVLLRWRARLYRADRRDAGPSDIRAARNLLVRAYGLAPEDWQLLSDYVATYEARAQPLPASVLDVLARAHAIAPQVDDIARRTAIALARAGEHAAAEAALAPLVNNPHVQTAMVLERTLLESLRKKDTEAIEAALLGISFAQGQSLAD